MDGILKKAPCKICELWTQVKNVLIGDNEGEEINSLAKHHKETTKAVQSNPTPSVLFINRSTPFNFAKLLGYNTDGLWAVGMEDDRSLALTEIDLNQVHFLSMVRPYTPNIRSKKENDRIRKANYIHLDAKIFETLWENQSLIPESWKEDVYGKTHYIYFTGTHLRVVSDPGGPRYVLCLYWSSTHWRFDYHGIGDVWGDQYTSAVLESTLD